MVVMLQKKKRCSLVCYEKINSVQSSSRPLLTDTSSSREIYFEDLLTEAAVTQSQSYIIHLFLRGYKTLVNYCLKCCPKTQRRSHTLSVWAASDVMGLQVKPVIIHFWAASWFIYLAFFFFFASLNDRLWVQSLKIQHLQDVVLWWLVQHKCYEKQIIYTEPLQL